MGVILGPRCQSDNEKEADMRHATLRILQAFAGLLIFTAPLLAQTADIAVSQFDSPDPVGAGNDVTYFLTLINNGPSVAANVVLNDVIPLGTTFVSLSQSAGALPTSPCSTPPVGGTGSVNCTWTTLAVTDFATFNLTVNVN